MDTPVLYSYSFAQSSSGGRLGEQAMLEVLKADDLAWAHLNANHPETEAWLRTNIDYLDQFIIDALLADNTRPRLEEIGDGALIILRGVNMNEDADPEDMVSLRLWIDKSRIISVQRRSLRAVKDLMHKVETTDFVNDSGDFIAQLSLKLFQNMEPYVSALNERLDDLEEELEDKADPQKRKDITDIRKKAIIFRRYFAPQKDVMGRLRSAEFSWINQRQQRELQENQDRITRYVEDLDAVRERAQIIKDELANILSDKLNKNLYVLSVITAIFLPLSFLTGLLGVNVGGIPGIDSADAFWIVCAICGGLSAMQLILFRILKWL